MLGQTHLLTSFGCAVGFLSDLAMCVAVKRRHCDIINLVLTVYVGQLELFLGLALEHQDFFLVSVMELTFCEVLPELSFLPLFLSLKINSILYLKFLLLFLLL